MAQSTVIELSIYMRVLYRLVILDQLAVYLTSRTSQIIVSQSLRSPKNYEMRYDSKSWWNTSPRPMVGCGVAIRV